MDDDDEPEQSDKRGVRPMLDEWDRKQDAERVKRMRAMIHTNEWLRSVNSFSRIVLGAGGAYAYVRVLMWAMG